MNLIAFYSVYPLLWLVGWLPFGLLYGLSDCLFGLLYYVVRYRRKVVRENLLRCFPEKTKREICRIERRFYRHFCDTTLETLKMQHLSEAEIKRRITLENPELLQLLIDQRRNTTVLLGHYGNWEWCSGLWAYYSATATPVNIYRRLRNPYFERFFLRLRSRFGAVNVEKRNVFRSIVRMQRSEGRPILPAFIADQTPSLHNIHYRTRFLNQQQTPVLTGAERIARQFDHAVVYVDVTKRRRGNYSLKLVLITEHAGETPEFKITELYTRLMEQTILRDPAFWLWTHKRWKHQ